MSRKYSGYSNIVSGKTLDPYAVALIARMTAAGEAPSAGHAAAICHFDGQPPILRDTKRAGGGKGWKRRIH